MSANATPSWKLAPPIDASVQALVVSGFGALPTGRALFLELTQPGGAWLTALRKVVQISSAEPPGDPPPETAAAIAFTSSGLAMVGLPANALESFSRPFREGMMQEDRLRRLGDRRKGEWLETVIEDGPGWSGNVSAASSQPTEHTQAFEVADPEPPEEHIRTPLTVHVMLLLYCGDDGRADAWSAKVQEALAPFGARIVHRLPLVLDPNGKGISSEHFGFADGLSQPLPFDEEVGAVTVSGAPVTRDPVQGIPLGEILIGYRNGHGEHAPGPVVPADTRKRPEAAGLDADPQAEGFFDFGRNGSYLVVRELKQDVAAFWRSMDRNAARVREQDPVHAAAVTPDWLAERVVGRNRDGHLLCTPAGSYRSADAHGRPDSSFTFHEHDPSGIGCPPGSHVRRANPRDALAPFPTGNARAGALRAANNHRILRRGRKFGRKIADERQDDGENRGLLFMCLNTDIARQFEFVQQTWLLNSNFATLLDETDPLVGPKGRMTIREDPLRRMLEVETFIKLAGGEYFFLPSLPALRFLELL